MTTKTAIAALALTALAGTAATGSAAERAPKIKAVSVQPSPAVGKDVVAIHFRTDGKIGRKANGKSIDASVGLLKPTEYSVGTESASKHCYLAFVKSTTIKAGAKRKIHFLVQGVESTRTVRATKDDGGKSIGC